MNLSNIDELKSFLKHSGLRPKDYLGQNFLEIENQPTLMVLMVQKEVGERVTAPSGELSILGISVQIYADAEIMLHVPKQSFWPVPAVDSVVLKITPRDKYRSQITDYRS